MPVRAQALAVIPDVAVVVAGIARVSLISNATLRKMRVRNSHATAILAIGGAGRG